MNSNIVALPAEVDKTGLWNITTILAYAKNITKNRADSHNGDEDSVASIIIVCIGLLMMMVMWVCTKDGVQLKCRPRRQEDDPELVPSSTPAESIPRISGVAAVWTRLQRKDSPPPPYEDPPSYDAALTIENEMQQSNIKCPS